MPQKQVHALLLTHRQNLFQILEFLLSEDVGVFGGLWLAVAHPWVFLCFLGLFVLFVIWLIPKIWKGIKKVFGFPSRIFGKKSKTQTATSDDTNIIDNPLITKQADQSLKECPMCTELISVRAKKCKHCGEYFESPSKETVNRTEETGTNEIEFANKVVEYHKIGLLALKGNYINLFFVTALFTFAISSLALTIIGFVLIPPIMYGYMAYILNLVRNKKSDYGLFFSGFGLKKYILSAIILVVLMGVYLAGFVSFWCYQGFI